MFIESFFRNTNLRLKPQTIYYLTLLNFLVFAVFGGCTTAETRQDVDASLRFVPGESGSFTFDTEVVKGVLRQSGKSIGLVPVTYKKGDCSIAVGEGLFNHYRVFTKDKRYGYGARRWPSTAELTKDGSVEVVWPVTADRPFELKATYTWVAPNVLDLTTIVNASEKLEDFEVFLASYYEHSFIDSRVSTNKDTKGVENRGYIANKQEYGEWQAFPRDDPARGIINDGRWELEPHPLAWTIMPNYDRPLVVRHDPTTGITVLAMAKRKDCFGVFTPYDQEKHISNYFSLFGYDIDPGETVSVLSRFVILSNPTEKEILEVTDNFLNQNP